MLHDGHGEAHGDVRKQADDAYLLPTHNILPPTSSCAKMLLNVILS